jgi:signal transduction histidine kinase
LSRGFFVVLAVVAVALVGVVGAALAGQVELARRDEGENARLLTAARAVVDELLAARGLDPRRLEAPRATAEELARALASIHRLNDGGSKVEFRVFDGEPGHPHVPLRNLCSADGRCVSLAMRFTGAAAGASAGASGWPVRSIAWASAMALLVAVLVGVWLWCSVVMPLEQITAAAEKVSAGDLSTRAESSERASAGHALTTFDNMLGELARAQRNLAKAERRAAWRDMAQRVAHEIKNPLLPIQISVETLRKARRQGHADFDAMFEEATATVLEEVERLRRIVSEFSDFARLPRPVPSEVNVGEVLLHVASVLGAGDDGSTVEVIAEGGPWIVPADRGQVIQAALNLAKNGLEAAREAGPQRGDAAPLVRLSVGTAAGRVTLAVEDNGAGVAEGERGQVFDPYYTTKATGTGLGLAIVQRIVEEHRGTIEVDRSALGGARFTITFGPGPVVDPATTIS